MVVFSVEDSSLRLVPKQCESQLTDLLENEKELILFIPQCGLKLGEGCSNVASSMGFPRDHWAKSSGLLAENHDISEVKNTGWENDLERH